MSSSISCSAGLVRTNRFIRERNTRRGLVHWNVDEEAAVLAHVELSLPGNCEQRVRHARVELLAAAFDLDGHQLVVGRDEVQLAAVAAPDRKVSASQLKLYQVTFRRAFHSVCRNQPVKRHENASMFYGQCQQVQIGNLARPVNSRGLQDCGIEQAHIVRPEFVKPGSARHWKPLNHGLNGQRAGIGRVRHDASTARIGRSRLREDDRSIVRYDDAAPGERLESADRFPIPPGTRLRMRSNISPGSEGRATLRHLSESA